MSSETGKTRERSDRLIAQLYRHDLGSPLHVLTVSMSSEEVGDIVGAENLDKEGKERIEEMMGFMGATSERLSAAGDIRAVEEELEHLATEFDPENFDGAISEYVERISDISSLVRDYVRSTEDELGQEITLDSVLTPLEMYGEIDYNGLGSEPVYGDHGLCMVANTLGLNSMDHGEKENGETEIWAEISEEEDLYEIDIWDNGSGLEDEKDPEKIFEKGNGDNSGLGLYFAREITELVDGNLKYSQENAEKEDGFGLRWELQKSGQYLTPESS